MVTIKKFSALLLLWAVAACVGTTAPSRFYSLQPMGEPVAKTGKASYSVGIGDVEIPAYLDRPQIVTVKGNGPEQEVSELNRWSEPLEYALQRVIADDIGRYLPQADVKPRNNLQEKFTYLVMIEIGRFDGNPGGETVLEAWWSIYNQNRTLLKRERAVIREPAAKGYDGLVMAQSRLAADLAEQIAAAIKKSR